MKKERANNCEASAISTAKKTDLLSLPYECACIDVRGTFARLRATPYQAIDVVGQQIKVRYSARTHGDIPAIYLQVILYKLQNRNDAVSI